MDSMKGIKKSLPCRRVPLDPDVLRMILNNPDADLPSDLEEFDYGASVSIQVSIDWVPHDLCKFVLVGKEEKITKQLDEIVASSLRRFAYLLSWQQIVNGFHNEIVEHIARRICKKDVLDTEVKAQKGSGFIEKFVAQGGVLDSHDFGIKITAITIASVEPEGKLKEFAEREAEEEKEGQGQHRELRDEIGQAILKINAKYGTRYGINKHGEVGTWVKENGRMVMKYEEDLPIPSKHRKDIDRATDGIRQVRTQREGNGRAISLDADGIQDMLGDLLKAFAPSTPSTTEDTDPVKQAIEQVAMLASIKFKKKIDASRIIEIPEKLSDEESQWIFEEISKRLGS